MSNRYSMAHLAALLLLCGFGLNSAAVAIPTFEFDFTAQCDDCAFVGGPTDVGFNPIGDGVFETVTGTLRLSDVSTNADGFVEVSNNNFLSFSYNGSSLINPFTFDDAFTIRGLLSVGGQVQAAQALVLETSDGSGGTFDFPNFCTALGEQVLGFRGCNNVGLVSFQLASDGGWSVRGTEAFDVGVNGQLTAATTAANVAEPATVALFGLGLLSLGFARRRAITRPS